MTAAVTGGLSEAMTIASPDQDPEEPDRATETGGETRAGMRPLLDDLQHLGGEARAAAAAEFAFQAARAGVIAAGSRNIALCVVFALVFVIFALGTLAIGRLLALTPLVTAWGATAIVVGLLGLAAALCLRGALSSWRRMRRAIFGKASDEELGQ